MNALRDITITPSPHAISTAPGHGRDDSPAAWSRPALRVFDIRNIIGALLGIYVGTDAKWVVWHRPTRRPAMFMTWAALRPVVVDADSESGGSTSPES